MKGFHVGWTQTESQLLEEAVVIARAQRLPLRTVFESVAGQTGRQPNSVRNYYYTQIKQSRSGVPAFVPFSEEESLGLVRAILHAQAKGESVRSCTLSLAGGDTKKMLRYQNKYRALLKNKPDVIARVRAELFGSGTPAHAPFSRAASKAPKQQQRPLETTIQELVSALYDSLLALAKRNSERAG
ncbi:MAG: hypothetical protein FWE69_08850 [Clostridiales bacterium]|nr:hypothetical protein [Clostridiales bacterium]